ncbi:hypothetical protein AG1IA_02046 [Rhizoctonia solani AG-1 IA]|uniref:Uncharacterized protein n=1 Tax=Thanatephorus cucumeris (strain AG1-IA) TaxID=983506 RepID=L8X118_THACA|nr:hypothetical protein AG1IA_02046 [Rhizoctonia solani AG-1 IA]
MGRVIGKGVHRGRRRGKAMTVGERNGNHNSQQPSRPRWFSVKFDWDHDHGKVRMGLMLLSNSRARRALGKVKLNVVGRGRSPQGESVEFSPGF